MLLRNPFKYLCSAPTTASTIKYQSAGDDDDNTADHLQIPSPRPMLNPLIRLRGQVI